MKRLTAVRVMMLCVALAVLCPSALAADSAREDEALRFRDFVEQTLAPMARANDYEWRIVQEFSNEELGALIEACGANGIVLPDDGVLMRAYRSGESYEEEAAIMTACEAFYGGTYWEWRIADRQWLRGVMESLGSDGWEKEELPGPDDLTEDEARAVLFAALHEAFGDDIPFEDPAQFSSQLSFRPDQEWADDGTRWEDGWSWELICRRRIDYEEFTAHADHAGGNARAHHSPAEAPLAAKTPQEAYSLRAEEAIHLAAEAIRAETGVNVPLEDPEVYSASAVSKTAARDSLLYWDVMFPSNSKDWGYCRATVEDVSRVVRVIQADAGPLTADNILNRYQNAYGFWGYWPLETWARLAEEINGLPAETLEGKILGSTPYILPREGLLTRLQADEIAFRAAGLTQGGIYCVVLIDADPHPVWKFCLMKQYEAYVLEYLTVEVDAATGEVLHLGKSHDRGPGYRVYSLESIWARQVLASEGPLPLAALAIHRTYDYAVTVEHSLEDESFWKPEVRGLNVVYKAQKPGLPEYAVRLGEDGNAEMVMVSGIVDGMVFKEVALGTFCASASPMNLDGVILPEDIQPFSKLENVVGTGRNILSRCRENGRWSDLSLLSITQYKPEHIWVFEYGKAPKEDEEDGSCFVAVNSRSGTIAAAWMEE